MPDNFSSNTTKRCATNDVAAAAGARVEIAIAGVSEFKL